MRFTVVLLVLLPCIALAGFRSLAGALRLFERDGCSTAGGICKKSGVTLSAELQELVQWGINTAAAQENSLKGFTLKKVNSYTTQVVAGANYEFDITVGNAEGEKRNVVLKIFDQPWTKTRELSILENVVIASEMNEGCNIAGGVCKKSGENLSAELQGLVQWGINTAAAQHNSLEGFQLEKVNTYTTQVVAGTNYQFDIVVVKDGQKKNLVFRIFDQPWTSKRELAILKDVTLTKEVDGCKLPGGVCKKPGEGLSNSAYEILQWGLKHAASQENSLEGFKLEKINSHSTQTVAGKNYFFDVIVVNGGERRHVEIKVYDRAWTQARQVTILKNEVI